jgi:hypothetical protein
MQFHEATALEKIESAEDVAASQAPTQPASIYQWDFLSPNRDEVLALLKPDGDRERTVWLVAGALVAGSGLDGLAALVGMVLRIWRPSIQ